MTRSCQQRWVDKASDTALLSVPRLKQPSLKLSQRADHYVGDTVYTVGDPKGLRGTFSTGIVSNFLKLENINYFQFTAPVSPGSSGGPVVDDEGRVIGIVNMQFTEGQNLNFATLAIYLQALIAGERSAPTRPSTALMRLRDEYIDASKDYKTSLEKLLPLYEKELQRLQERSAKDQELFKQGLIFKRDLDATDRAVTDAKLKIANVRRQMDSTDAQISQVLKDASDENLAQEYKRAVARQPTCTTWTLTASGQEKPSNSIFAFKIVCRK